MKKILEPMKAFSGIKDMFGLDDPFGDCMSMADLAILNHFGLSDLEIIYNLHFVYKFLDIKEFGCPAFSIGTLLFDKRENILKGLGIDIIEKQPKMELLVENIRESIMNNRPIFLFVDLFYQKGRYFYYNNRHAPHACLVYGFDDENQVVYTIDDYNGYKTYIVSYDMIVQYCKGIFDYCNFRKDSLYFREYCFKDTNLKFDEEYDSQVLKKFFKNSLSNAEDRYNSLNTIKILSQDIESFMELPSFELNICGVIYKRASECFLIKKLYKYNIFDKNIQSEIDSKQNTILYNWKLIRNTACHYNMNKKNINEKCNKIKRLLEAIYEDETIYSDLLYSQFKQLIK